MSQLTRDYKASGRRPPQMSGMKEFGLGVLAGALLTGGAAALITAHTHHGQHKADRPVCASPSETTAKSPRRLSARSASSAAPSPQPAAVAHDSATTGAGASAPAARKRAAAPAQKYDFYQMLPKLTVPVGGSAAAPAHRSGRTAGAPTQYLLQVGSYSSDAEAQRVRGRLARLGITAQIQRITQHGRTLNRVRIGPVDAAQTAHIRSKLASAGIRPLVLPVSP